ncbi:hypothetical protein CERSUDRAFT_82229 [Gelatoporia subvermispora B]|uniref:Uncharacterized protein n=1 Tax=Ceriporiopsis subvermispora (strain B) TaxID=914234 RepID=M2RGV8_CERS8|nr:hypothetical protein CERSUDRAFT_82229 [Gelatoporia subvermispora B]
MGSQRRAIHRKAPERREETKHLYDSEPITKLVNWSTETVKTGICSQAQVSVARRRAIDEQDQGPICLSRARMRQEGYTCTTTRVQ